MAEGRTRVPAFCAAGKNRHPNPLPLAHCSPHDSAVSQEAPDGMPPPPPPPPPDRRNAGTPERRNAGTPERRNAGTPERRLQRRHVRLVRRHTDVPSSAARAARQCFGNGRVAVGRPARPLRQAGRDAAAGGGRPLPAHDRSRPDRRRHSGEPDLRRPARRRGVGHAPTCAPPVDAADGRPPAPTRVHVATGGAVHGTAEPPPPPAATSAPAPAPAAAPSCPTNRCPTNSFLRNSFLRNSCRTNLSLRNRCRTNHVRGRRRLHPAGRVVQGGGGGGAVALHEHRPPAQQLLDAAVRERPHGQPAVLAGADLHDAVAVAEHVAGAGQRVDRLPHRLVLLVAAVDHLPRVARLAARGVHGTGGLWTHGTLFVRENAILPRRRPLVRKALMTVASLSWWGGRRRRNGRPV